MNHEHQGHSNFGTKARTSPITSITELDDEGTYTSRPNKQVRDFLLNRVAEFRRLSELRKEGWKSEAGDAFFKRQRSQADKPNPQGVKWFYNMMQNIAWELNEETAAFSLPSHTGKAGDEQRVVFDFCIAPGGFLKFAVDRNPGVRAMGFTLPVDKGGHAVLLPQMSTAYNIQYLDITMLGGDMGMPNNIPATHADLGNFLQPKLDSALRIDLALCDGQVLRTHERPAYREPHEAVRLVCTQLALGLEHLRPGGTMIVLLHKFEAWHCVHLLFTFSKFAEVLVHKPKRAHQKRSSFYMIAKDVQNHHVEAKQAVKRWKDYWRVATFGTAEELQRLRHPEPGEVESVLERFGDRLIELGTNVWRLQADALAKAPFIKQT